MKLFKKRKSSKDKSYGGMFESEVFTAGIVNGGLIAPNTSQDLLESTLDNAAAVDYAIFNSHDFGFENIVMEGGGMKGLAYVGALTVLLEAGILDGMKRICGVSIGSILALFLYIGCSPDELREFMYEDVGYISLDHKCGYCSLLPGLKKRYGWNPGKRLEKWFKSKIKAKLGDPDITFKKAYEMTGKEFCVVVTNLNRVATEYFHVKTTPNIQLSTAVYISAAIPAVFQGRFIEKANGTKDLYVDGGLLCNYPVHAFDGWWLSLKPEDSFFKRLPVCTDDISYIYDKSERFGEWNPATIGMLLYSQDEIEVMKTRFQERPGATLPPPPTTSKKYRQRKKLKQREQHFSHSDDNIMEGFQFLVQTINGLDSPKVNCIPLQKLKEELEKSENFSADLLHSLFGVETLDELMNELDADGDGEITHVEFIEFAEKKGLDMYSRFIGYNRRDISNLKDYFAAIEAGLSVNLLKSYVEARDADRTIGINTGYMETTDFYMEEQDKAYLEECGVIAAKAFLRDHCRKNPTKRQNRSKMMASRYFTDRRRSLLTNKFLEIVEREEEKLMNDPDYEERVFESGSTLQTEETESVINTAKPKLTSKISVPLVQKSHEAKKLSKKPRSLTTS